MNPLYLGTSERRLFAVYEAATRKGTPRAAVLCHPVGEEYLYAHRSMRQLARKLAASGCHTIRFDYYGTGDSGGEITEADLAGWEADTETAVESLQEMVGVSQVTLIGLRLGANIALRVAARHAAVIRSLVLWEPIVRAENYLAELRAAWRTSAMTLRWQSDIAALDLRRDIGAFPNRSLVVMNEAGGNAAGAQRLLNEAGVGARVTFESLSAPCPWIESVTMTGAMPVPIIQRIEQWLN